MKLYALVCAAVYSVADLILGIDAWRGVGGPSKSQAAFLSGRW